MFAENDVLVRSLAQALQKRGLVCSSAESCTGGLVGAMLTAVPGSSDWYLGGVISYANRRWSRGDVYRRLGFDLLKVSAPNYWYVRGDEVISRYQAQKHKLPQLLGEGFDPELSESENMQQAGFERIYDCGNLVFGFTS